MRRASFMTLSSHAEGTEIALVRHPTHSHVLDACGPRSVAQFAEKMLEGAAIAFGLHLHRAIVSIAHVTLKAQAASMPFGKEAESYPLDVTNDLRLEPAAVVCRVTRQSGVRERGRGHHDGDVLRRVRDRLEGTANDREVGLD
jgi:hypothetical protein